MGLFSQLYQGELICLCPIDHEKDPPVMSHWTHDSECLGWLDTRPASPQSTFQVKKGLEALEKEIEERGKKIFFTIRLCSDDSLVGFIHLSHIDWANGACFIQLAIGEVQERGKGYGNEALRLMLRYVFSELNLNRITAVVPTYNEAAQKLFKKLGFCEEVRQRQAILRNGKRWDLLRMGILRSEWEAAL